MRTLRYYDELGLLRPIWVDSNSGHRWYAPEQIGRLHRILALRELGVALTDIGRLIDVGVSSEELRGILLLRRAEATERMAMEAQRLARVEARLTQLKETNMMDFDIVVKRVEEAWAATTSESIADISEIGATQGLMWSRIHAVLERHGIERAGPSVAVETSNEDPERPLHLTTAVPVPEGTSLDENSVTTGSLLAIPRAAATVIMGDPAYDGPDFAGGFAALRDWAETMGQEGTGEFREMYLDCDGPRVSWVVEVQMALL